MSLFLLLINLATSELTILIRFSSNIFSKLITHLTYVMQVTNYICPNFNKYFPSNICRVFTIYWLLNWCPGFFFNTFAIISGFLCHFSLLYIDTHYILPLLTAWRRTAQYTGKEGMQQYLAFFDAVLKVLQNVDCSLLRQSQRWLRSSGR